MPPAPPSLLLADKDRRIQEYCVAHLHCVAVDLPPEIAGGIRAIIRLLFAEADYRDPASAKLWCSLSVREIAVRLDKHRDTIRAWLKGAKAHEPALIYDSRDADRRKLRHRPAWDAIASQIHAAACAGRIPGPPLFHEVIDEINAESLSQSPDSLGQLFGETPSHSANLAGRNAESLGESADFLSSLGGGTGGKTPLKGGFPPVPTRDQREQTNLAESLSHSADLSANSGEKRRVTQPISRRRPVQMLLDFGRSIDEKLADLAHSQRATQGMCERILGLVLGLFASRDVPAGRAAPQELFPKKPRAKKSGMPAAQAGAASGAASGAAAGEESRRLTAWLAELSDGDQERFLTACAANLGPLASHYDARKAIQSGGPKTLAFAAQLSASDDWRRP